MDPLRLDPEAVRKIDLLPDAPSPLELVAGEAGGELARKLGAVAAMTVWLHLFDDPMREAMALERGDDGASRWQCA